MKGPSGIVVNLLLVIGAVTTSFAFTKNIPYNYSFVGFLMLPCLLSVASTMNLEIMQQIVFCFDSMLLLAYGTVGVAALLISCSDARVVTLCFGYLYMFMLVFTDACPEKVRRAVGLIGSVTLILWLFTLLFALKANKVEDLTATGFEFGGTVYTTIDVTFISASNYCIFLAHHIYNAFAHPSNFVVLTSRMKSVKVEKDDAMKLTTVQKEVKRRETRSFSGRDSPSSRRSFTEESSRSFTEVSSGREPK
ncbi:hypothetical protein TrVE_jg9807 [Triparma verrucosa]|uniref:Uncharacterized protein n=1 Tax=Triparma verrucosa TaxID=1606542 RepID=A0A9W7F3A1_9STRA|nr:hypothetical protein TrVE_jg9807 [Triparma verrucosa]